VRLRRDGGHRGPFARLLGVRLLLDVQFWFPTWMIFLLGQGYSPLEAAAVDAVFHAALVIAEVPMGRVVDRIGRRRAMLAVCALTTVIFAGIGLVDSFWLMAVVWGVWGVLWALGSGLDTTYAWELAESRPGMIEPQRYLGWTRLAGGVAGLGSLLSAGLLLEIWPPLPYLVTSALGIAALLLALSLPEVRPLAAASAHGGVTTLREALRIPAVRTGIALGAIVLTVGISIRILFQPLGLRLGMDPMGISVSYALIAVAVAIGGWLASRIGRRHRGRWVSASIGLMAVSFLLVAPAMELDSSWLTMFVAIPLGAAAFGLGKTLTDIWLVESVGPHWRATVISIASAANGLAMVAIRPAIVVASDSTGIGSTFLLWGAASVVLCVLSIVLLGRSDPSSARPPLT